MQMSQLNVVFRAGACRILRITTVMKYMEGGCSTPMDGALLSLLPEHLNLSEIIDERKSSTSFANCTSQSAESSAPPSCSEIIKTVGDAWMQEFGVTYERFDVEKPDVGKEEKNNQRNENEIRSVGKGRADVQKKDNNKRNKNAARGVEEGRSDLQEKQDTERHRNEVRDVDEGRADIQEEEDNERNNNEVRDIDEGRAGESYTEDDNDDFAKDSDYSDENCIEDDNYDVANDSDYLPDKSTSNRSCQILQVNLTKNLSKSNNDALPVDIRRLNVPTSKNPATKNVKKYFCPYCQKLQTKFARHLEVQHKSEADVGRFTKLPKGNHERAKIIEAIRKHGNFLHNTDLDLNTGILITCRRRQQKYDRSVEDYVCCSTCKGFFSKQTLRLHIVKCNTARKKRVRDMTVMGRRLTGYIHKLANPVLRRTVFPVMRDDQVVRSIKYDELLILFANRLCDKYTHAHQHDMIRAQLRLLGRFKCTIKDINKEIDDFASILHPKFYDTAILAVRECAKYDSVTQTFQTPAVATMLGTLIKKCISRRKAQCIRKQDYEGKKAAVEFLVLFEDDFLTTINKKVMEDQTKQKCQKKIILPSSQDIRKLYDFLKNKCQASLATLEKQFDLSAWNLLTV